MSELIQHIEGILQLKLNKAPERDGDLLGAVMPFKENFPKYALDGEGQVIGLNLAKTGLTDEKWQKVLALSGLAEHLRALNLSENELTKFDSSRFSSLIDLNLSENKSLKEVSFLTPLPNLARLDLSECIITNFQLSSGFNNLKYLDLRGNGMEQVQISPCLSLEFLDLSQNVLEKLGLKGEFKQLKFLYLNKNWLEEIVFDAALPGLHILQLLDNHLSDITLDFLDPFPNIQSIYLSENPLPDALCGFLEDDSSQNSLEHVRRYIREMSDGTDIDNESKVLLIGNGNVGKSCLVERLVHNRFREEWDSTHAISLEQYPHEDFLLNLWDFGGQDIYHATHRLFMQSNAIYLLLWDWKTEQGAPISRFEAGQNRLYKNFPLSYWLDYARILGSSESPVIVVQTKMLDHQKKDCPGGIREKYTKQFTFFDCDQHIDSKENDWKKNGLRKLIITIEEALARIKPKRDIPFKYAEMRRYLRILQKAGEKHLELTAYVEKAVELKIEEPVGVLENWLTKTGVVFYKKGLFENKIILDQAWAIQAIYTLFNRDEGYYFEIQVNQGSFSGKDLERYWQTPITQNEAERELFVSFMLSCEMCFETTPKQKDHHYMPFPERTFIAPQLLSELKPRSVEIVERNWGKGQDMLYLRFRHEFLHYGIIQSFIVRTQYLASVDDIWQHGILLEEEGENALIESSENEIKVTTTATGKTLLQKIRNLLLTLQDAPAVESVSLDGENFVKLEHLKKHAPVNPVINSEKDTPLEYKPLSIFLNLDEKFIFQKPTMKNMSIEEEILPVNINQPQVYVSYAWGGESGKIVDKIDEELQNRGINIIRDIKNVAYRGSIRAFMEEIGRGNKVILILSKKYFESKNCMFELTQIFQNEGFKSRIFPVILDDANIYSVAGRVAYINYWDAKIEDADKAIKSVKIGTDISGLQQELNELATVRASFDKISSILRDMNALDPEMHQNENFETLYKALTGNHS